MSIILFIIVLAVLVLAHEAGHFFAARRAGVRVDEFGFGFPPRIWGKKIGETLYSINWIPLGGFVKIKGETGSEHRGEPDSFVSKSIPRRLGILAAGVIMNVLLAIVLFSIAYMVGVPKSLTNVSQNAQIENRAIRLAEVLPGSPNSALDLKPGDIISQIDTTSVFSVDEFRTYVKKQPIDAAVSIQIERGSQKKNIIAKVFEHNGDHVVGLSLIDTGLVSYSFFSAIVHGAKDTFVYTLLTFKGFGDLIYGLFAGHGVPQSLTGPVGLVVITGQAAVYGMAYFLSFMGLLSINLAVLNILPIPALDGGRILFVLIEMIRRKPNDEKVENIIHLVGYSLLMLLVLFITFKDIGVYGGHILDTIKNWF